MPDGVKFNAPPASILASAEAIVREASAQLGPNDAGGIVTVATEAGVNAAIVHRFGNRMAITGWIGKTWTGPVTGGGAIVVRFPKRHADDEDDGA